MQLIKWIRACFALNVATRTESLLLGFYLKSLIGLGLKKVSDATIVNRASAALLYGGIGLMAGQGEFSLFSISL